MNLLTFFYSLTSYVILYNKILYRMTLKIDDLSDLGKKGVYRILNICNGKMYIGSTVDSFKTRLRTHINKMRTNKHPNTHLQGAYNKYGEENFSFNVLTANKTFFFIKSPVL